MAILLFWGLFHLNRLSIIESKILFFSERAYCTYFLFFLLFSLFRILLNLYFPLVLLFWNLQEGILLNILKFVFLFVNSLLHLSAFAVSVWICSDNIGLLTCFPRCLTVFIRCFSAYIYIKHCILIFPLSFTHLLNVSVFWISLVGKVCCHLTRCFSLAKIFTLPMT